MKKKTRPSGQKRVSNIFRLHFSNSDRVHVKRLLGRITVTVGSQHQSRILQSTLAKPASSGSKSNDRVNSKQAEWRK